MNKAEERYKARAEQIKRNLEILKKLLKEDAKEKDKNWGHVGSIGEVASHLETAVMYLGGNPVKLMENVNVLLYPAKQKGACQYVTVPE
jgi:hypothetical protein